MNKALLEQLALAKDAGSKAEAKDFFAKPPNEAEAPMGEEEGGMPPAGEEEMTPEQLEELMALLGSESEPEV